MAGPVERTTKGFGFNIIRFDFPSWHRFEHDNWDMVDAVLRTYVTNFLKGIWRNSTSYAIGDRVIDDDTSETYEALTNHISSPEGTFSEERGFFPTYWKTTTYDPNNRGTWAAGVVYNKNDFVDYNYKYTVVKESHLSTNFDADVLSGKLEVLIDMGPALAAAVSFDPGNFVPITRTVNTKPLSGNITLNKSDIGLSDVDNTADLAKPVSVPVATQLATKATILSPTAIPFLARPTFAGATPWDTNNLIAGWTRIGKYDGSSPSASYTISIPANAGQVRISTSVFPASAAAGASNALLLELSFDGGVSYTHNYDQQMAYFGISAGLDLAGSGTIPYQQISLQTESTQVPIIATCLFYPGNTLGGRRPSFCSDASSHYGGKPIRSMHTSVCQTSGRVTHIRIKTADNSSMGTAGVVIIEASL